MDVLGLEVRQRKGRRRKGRRRKMTVDLVRAFDLVVRAERLILCGICPSVFEQDQTVEPSTGLPSNIPAPVVRIRDHGLLRVRRFLPQYLLSQVHCPPARILQTSFLSLEEYYYSGREAVWVLGERETDENGANGEIQHKNVLGTVGVQGLSSVDYAKH